MPLQLTHVGTRISSRLLTNNNCFKPTRRFLFPQQQHLLSIVRSPYSTTFLIDCFLANRATFWFVCLSVCSSCLKTKFGQLSCLSCCCGRARNFWGRAVVCVKRKENFPHTFPIPRMNLTSIFLRNDDDNGTSFSFAIRLFRQLDKIVSSAVERNGTG